MRSILPLVSRCWLVFVLASALSACAPRLPTQMPDEHAQVPAEFPQADYLRAAAAGKKVLRVDTRNSLVVIEVHRGGSLARLGHDHAVASRDVTGYVLPEEGRADLYVQLDRLSVDEPALRAEAGFDTQPQQSAIDGTRTNMLDKVLEAARFPFALIQVTRKTDNPSQLIVSITLHGQRRNYDIAAHIKTDASGTTVDGQMALNQSDFGIAPFSILGGALQVQDRVDLRFHVQTGLPI